MEPSELLLEYGINAAARTIKIVGEVDDDLYFRLVSGLDYLTSLSSDKITVELTSYGGDAYVGIAMHDAIKQAKVPVDIIAIGPVMSAGSVILQAGAKRLAKQNAVVMLHFGFEINESGTQARVNAANNKVMKDIFVNRTGKSARTVNKWLDADTYFTAEESLKAGLIDEVVP